jgi:hypothetical protein
MKNTMSRNLSFQSSLSTKQPRRNLVCRLTARWVMFNDCIFKLQSDEEGIINIVLSLLYIKQTERKKNIKQARKKQIVEG